MSEVMSLSLLILYLSIKHTNKCKIQCHIGCGHTYLYSQHSGGRGRQISEFMSGLVYIVGSRSEGLPCLKKMSGTVMQCMWAQQEGISGRGSEELALPAGMVREGLRDDA